VILDAVPRVSAFFVLAGVCGLAVSADVAAKSKPPLPCKFKGAKKYPGDGAPRVALAQWMGEGALKHRLPVELPVMGALVASGLQNLPAGDADSAGFFQMRVGIWDTGEYAGFRQHPELQLQWFINQALLVAQRRVADGIPLDELLSNPLGYGEWVADILRPPEQLRGEYQRRLTEAQALICS
jgi:hypothetical protein